MTQSHDSSAFEQISSSTFPFPSSKPRPVENTPLIDAKDPTPLREQVRRPQSPKPSSFNSPIQPIPDDRLSTNTDPISNIPEHVRNSLNKSLVAPSEMSSPERVDSEILPWVYTGNVPNSIRLEPPTADAVSIYPPSNFYFYPFKSLSVKPIRGFQQAKFARAAREKKTAFIAEALTSILPRGTDLEGNPVQVFAEDLTIPDFYWLLYWLRINFYTRTQLIHKGVCTNPEHLKKVDRQLLPVDSLITTTSITSTTLKEEVLTENFLEGFQPSDFDTFLKYGYMLYPPTMRDAIDLEENNYTSDPDLVYLSDFASCLKRLDGKSSPLKDRIMFVEQLSADELEVISDYQFRVSNYGVVETLKFQCKECRADVETQVSISAHSFL